MYQRSGGFQLIVRRGPQPNQSYELSKEVITLGRDITNDIVINDPEVSRHHMRLTLEGNGYTLQDLGSTNGTFVNGERIMNVKNLQNGDMIALGETVTLAYEVISTTGYTMESGSMMSSSPPSGIQGEDAPFIHQPSSYSEEHERFPQNQEQIYSPSLQQIPGQGYYQDYDQDVEPDNTLRFVLIGCGILFIFACCMLVVAVYIVDANCLWDDIPIVSDILSAIGYQVNTNLAECL